MSAATLKYRAYEAIRGRIVRGDLPAHSRLSPAALAKHMGISHIPVREAISQLQSEGLVEQVPRLGAFVKVPGRRELLELIELRDAIECYAVGKAARRIKEADLRELAACEERLRALAEAARAGKVRDQAGHQRKWLAIDLALHAAILRATGNQRMRQLLEQSRVMTRMFGPQAATSPAREPFGAHVMENFRVHHAIIQAIRRRDPLAARRAMRAHMRRTRHNVLERFDCLERQRAEATPLEG